jgi:two-component SAPR family response regulator
MDAEPWRLVANVDTWRLEPPALDVSPFGLTSVEDRGVRSMIERARSPWPSTIATVGESDTSEPTDPSNTWSYMVRVLGNVDVVDRQGNRVPIERGKSLELLTWLALHRRHPSREAARTALWDSDVRDSTFANVVSEARRALHRHAARPDGDEWLRRGNSERIEVHDGVVTDEEIFRRHVSRARREGGEVAIDEWRRALELVRGAPFVGSGYGWADAEVLTSNLTLMIVDTAVDLAEAELEAGRIAGAFRATGLGLMVLPGHEQLVAIRLRSHARAGDHAGLRHEWRTYERSLLDDPWQSEPSPWLAELVEELIAESVVR